MGQALRGTSQDRGVGGRTTARRIAGRLTTLLCALALCGARVPAQDSVEAVPRGAGRFDRGRLTIVAFPSDGRLASALLSAASRTDSFPGLQRPRKRAVIAIAPDARRFREWVGAYAPEWGAAIAFPASGRIILQGSAAGSDAGDPVRVLRHELAHLALHEALGDLPPRWFDEGYASYAAGEWDRDEVLATSLALALRRTPTLDRLDSGFTAGAMRADAAYALAHRAVAELAALDPERGLSLFFVYWRETGKFDTAIRRAYGITQAEYEERFRKNTRRRFGWLAVATDVSIVGTIMLAVMVPLSISRRRRDRRRLALMRIADAAADRRAQQESERAIEELLRTLSPPPGPSEGSSEASGPRQ